MFRFFTLFLLSLSFNATADTHLKVAQDPIAPGATATLEWGVESVEKPVTLALFTLGAGNDKAEHIHWKSEVKSLSGSVKVRVPKEAGLYEFRVLQGTPTKTVYSSSVVHVEAMIATPSAVQLGGRVQLRFAPPAEVKKDIIVLYQTKPIKKIATFKVGTTRTLEVTLPSKPGLYDFRYFPSGKEEYVPLRSHTVSVVECGKEVPKSKIKNLVILVPENHSFDSYFSNYCKAAPHSNPSCSNGPECCEKGPERDPGTGNLPIVLNDEANRAFDPNHHYDCNVLQANGGKMDRYINAPPGCGDPRNFAYADKKTVGGYWKLAEQYSMGDRAFHSIAGASISNNMYFARGGYVFTDNAFEADAIGGVCAGGPRRDFHETTIGDLLNACGIPWTYYAEGYAKAKAAHPKCLGVYPDFFDPGDVQVEFYPSSKDKPEHMQDWEEFKTSVKNGTLPAVSFVKSLGTRCEHPKVSSITDGVAFTEEVLDLLLSSSKYKESSLLVVTPDEGGGYFDHIAPPKKSAVDGKEYGVRVFFMALGHFAKKNHISHTQLEHVSLLNFIEWNWFGGKTGQLGTRDAVVNNIGSLLDPAKTGVEVP